MHGKTKEQLKKRLTISIITGIILVIMLFVTQFILASIDNNQITNLGLTWGEFIVLLAICIPAYIVYAFGLLTNWKVQFLEPFQNAKGTTWFLWAFVFFFWYMLGGFKTYIVGFKAMIYVFSPGY